MQVIEECNKLENNKLLLSPWLVCFAASLFFFYEFIQGNMFASIADNIMQDFHLEADKMAYLSSMYYFSNVLFLFAAGFLLDRFSTKNTLLIAMFLCVLSTFVLAYTHSFYIALACRFITGIGSAFCFLGPIRIASRWFPPKRMALVTGAIVTMAMSGGMLSQYPLTKLVVETGWRNSLIILGWLGVVMFVAMVVWIKDQPGNKDVSHNDINHATTSTIKRYDGLQVLGAASYTSLMNMSFAVFGAMIGSLYLMQRLGVSKEDAALVNSMLFLGAIFGGPFIGWCSDKLNLRILPMKVGAVLSCVVLMCILYVPVSMFGMGCLFFLLGFFTSSQVISYALVAESTSPVVTAMALSVISILTQGGYILYQNLFSFLLSHHGEMLMNNGLAVYSLEDYQAAALMLPVGLLIALLLLFRLKETYCRQNFEGSAV